MADFNPSDDGYSIKSGNTAGSNVAEKLLGSRNNGTAYTMIETGYGGASTSHYIGPRPITAVNYFSINRAHMIFDLSGADAGTIESATLKVYASTADGGGITLKGTTDKTIVYEYDTQSWDSNLDWHINKSTDDSRLVIDTVQVANSSVSSPSLKLSTHEANLNTINTVTSYTTSSLVLPVGTTGTRVNTQGGIRYNTTSTSFEGYDGSCW